MISYITGDIDRDAGKEDLRILFKETNAYRTTVVTNAPHWSTIIWRIRAVQLDLRKKRKLCNVRPHTLRRMLIAYYNW
jgi:hypothetical protein